MAKRATNSLEGVEGLSVQVNRVAAPVRTTEIGHVGRVHNPEVVAFGVADKTVDQPVRGGAGELLRLRDGWQGGAVGLRYSEHILDLETAHGAVAAKEFFTRVRAFAVA